MTLLIRRLAGLGVVAVVAVLACTEDLTAPGRCDDFCPPEKIVMHDTILDTAITRDSAYGRPIGYINPPGAPVMFAESLPGLRTSRAIFRFNPVALLRRVIAPPDTTTGPLLQPDSVFVGLRIVRREAKATNLTLHIYRMPLTIDSTTTFSDPAVSDSFATALLRSVNLDTLLAQPKIKDSLIAIDSVHFDSTTGDRISVDTTTGPVQYRLILKFDSLAVPFDTTDSGRVALGVRVTADSFASISLSASEQLNGQPPSILWFNRFDSLGTFVSFRQAPRSTAGPGAFDGFVGTPGPTALDSNLLVGGLPAARSLLRLNVPRGILDSTQIVRATLILIPSDSIRGVPSDSFNLLVLPAAVDFGAKTSNLADPRLPPDSAIMRVGRPDTVQIEVTNILRRWQVDTTLPRTMILEQQSVPHLSGFFNEGATLAEARFYSSRAALQRPRLRITYIPRITFAP